MTKIKDIYGIDPQNIQEKALAFAHKNPNVIETGKAILENGSKCQEIFFDYIVIDTQVPIIEAEDDIQLSLNSKDELKDSIRAYDIVDGDLKVRIEGEIQWDQEGTYDLVLKASDRNGNVSQKKIKLTLIDEKEEVIANVDVDTETNSNGGTDAGNAESNPNPSSTPQAKPSPVPQPKPKPQPASEPVEDHSWKRNPKDFLGHDGVKMYFHKNYGDFEGCRAIADDLLDEMNWNGNWNSSFCDSNGDLYYSED